VSWTGLTPSTAVLSINLSSSGRTTALFIYSFIPLWMGSEPISGHTSTALKSLSTTITE